MAYGSGYATGYADDVVVEPPVEPPAPPAVVGGGGQPAWRPYRVIRRDITVRVTHQARWAPTARVVSVTVRLFEPLLRRAAPAGTVALKAVGIRTITKLRRSVAVKATPQLDQVALARHMVETRELSELAVILQAWER